MSSKHDLRHTVLAAMFLSLALVLPFLTGQIPSVGNMLCPMHLPVLLCGFLCGPWYGLAVGAVAPLLRFALFGMPPLVPTGLAMCFELAAYGFFAGMLYRLLPKRPLHIYVALLCAMLLGRIVWAAAELVLYGLGKTSFGWKVFVTQAFVKAVPGILLQIVLVPVLVMLAGKSRPSSAR